MPQGKFKKNKLPSNIQNKQKPKHHAAFTRRANAPIRPKKSKLTEQQKIKQVISKTLNKTLEKEMRERVNESNINLSKAQQAVVKHHKENE